mgnify:CR=1 FL=1
MNICVYGASSPLMGEYYITNIQSLCKTLAQRGHSLVFGAGDTGAMGAAARGFKEGGGYIKGVVPKKFTDRNIEALYDDCDELVLTKDMGLRKKLMEDSADAFVICPGGIGTFDELFQALTLKQIGELDKPIAIFNIKGYYSFVQELMLNAERNKLLWEKWRTYYKIFSEDEAAQLIKYLETGE